MKLKSLFFVSLVIAEDYKRVLVNAEGYEITIYLHSSISPAFLPMEDFITVEFDAGDGAHQIEPDTFLDEAILAIATTLKGKAYGVFGQFNSGGSYYLGTDNAWMGKTSPYCAPPASEYSLVRREVARGLFGNHIGTWTYDRYLTGPNHLISPWHWEQLIEGRSTWHKLRSTFVDRETGEVLFDNTLYTPFDCYSGVAAHSAVGVHSQVPGQGVVSA
jgi:hypothetical protein